MIKKASIALLLATLVFSTSNIRANNFKTLEDFKQYASYYQEYPDIDNDNWLNPDYTSFHKQNIPGWFGKIFGGIFKLLGLSKKPVWSADEFEYLLEKVIEQREKNGYLGRFVQKITPTPDAKFIIFGDLHSSFHSLVRDLEALKDKGIVDNNLNIKENNFFVFNGNVVDLSPYIMETLTLVLRLMEVNPKQVFYIRGFHEDKEHWRNFGLRQERELRTPNVSEKTIRRFMNTLTLALYLVEHEGQKTDAVRISTFDRNYQELDEDNFADFFARNHKNTIRNLEVKTESKKPVDIKVIIKTEDRLVKQTATTGLVQTDSDKGATAWMVLSGPNRTFRSLYKFFYDAFAVLKTSGPIDRWTITLYNQDVREALGIKKRVEYNLATGDKISKVVPKKVPTKKIKPERELEPQEIVVGTTLGLTGNVKEESENVRLGLQMRINKENHAGGINGKKIRLIVLDDGYNPKRARANVEELINKYNVNVILTPVGSATTKAYFNLIEEKKIVLLFSTSGSMILRDPTPEYMIHFRPSYPDMYDALIAYTKKNFDAKKFAFVYQSDAIAAGIKETIKRANIQEKNYIKVTHKRNLTDMTKQAEQIQKFKPDVIVLWTTTAAAIALIKAVGTENLIDTKMVGGDLGMERFNEFLKKMGVANNYIDAQAIPNPKTSTLPILKNYREALAGKPITGMSAEAYIDASIFIHLVKQTGGTTNKAKIIEAAKQIKNLDLGGIRLNFDKKNRQLSPFIWLNTGKKSWIPVNVTPLEQIKEPAPKKPEPEEKGDFVIGSSLDLSKSLKFEGEKMREGLDLFARKINREGGIRGRKVKLVVLDDGYDPKTARENIETLINKYKTSIILSPLGSPTTAGYLDLVKSKKVLVVFPFTGSQALRDPSYVNFLHLTPPYDQIELALFKYAQEKLHADKFALFAQADEMTAGVKAILKKSGISKDNYTLLGYERNTTDFADQVKATETFKPDAIALLSTSRAATSFLRQLGVEDLVGKKLLGIQLGDINFKQFMKQQGLIKQFYDIQTVPNPESDIEIMKEYRNEMSSKKTDAYSAVAYMAAAIFFDILKRTKGPLTHQNIIKTAEETKNYNFKGLPLNFTPSSRTMLNYIWFDAGGKKTWDRVEVKPENISPKTDI